VGAWVKNTPLLGFAKFLKHLGVVVEKLRYPKFFNFIFKFWFGAGVEILKKT